MSHRPVTEPHEELVTSRSPRLRRAHCAAFAAALLLYAISMAPGVLWQDSGMAQVRVLQRDIVGERGLALSHPLYYLLAFALQLLPLAESAFKTNLVSALFGALTVANVYLLLRLATGHRAAAAVGALSLAVAHTFWQHCALAEVYTVSTALLSAELLCIHQYATTSKPRWLVLLFLLNGLGVSNHMLATLSLACYAFLTVWLLWCGKLRPVVVPLLALAWIVGAGFYLALIVAQLRAGETLGATVHSALFGTAYPDHVLNVVPGRKQLINSILYLGLSFPTPAALLVIPGLAALRVGRLKTLRAVLIALLAIHLVWAIRYDVLDQYTFFIPSLVLLAIVIGLGAARFLAGRSGIWSAMLVAGALLPVAVYTVLPGLTRAVGVDLGVARPVPYRDAHAYFLRPWKTGYRGAERFARELGAALPENAVLFADVTTVQPVHYLQLTGGWRSDVRVVPPPKRRRDVKAQDWEELLSAELAQGLVFVVTPQRGYCPRWLLERYEFSRDGLAYRVTGRTTSQGNVSGANGMP